MGDGAGSSGGVGAPWPARSLGRDGGGALPRGMGVPRPRVVRAREDRRHADLPGVRAPDAERAPAVPRLLGRVSARGAAGVRGPDVLRAADGAVRLPALVRAADGGLRARVSRVRPALEAVAAGDHLRCALAAPRRAGDAEPVRPLAGGVRRGGGRGVPARPASARLAGAGACVRREALRRRADPARDLLDGAEAGEGRAGEGLAIWLVAVA